MRIGIIGYGVVGQAVAALHDRTMLMINDPYTLEEWNSYTVDKIMKNCGWIYLCLPTPSNDQGACDTSILTTVFDQLKNYEGIVISKSTAPPKFYIDALEQTKKPGKYKFRLIHMPEFLRMDHALEDAMNPNIIVIGGTPTDTNYAQKFIIHSEHSYKHKAQIIKTDIGSAAAIKYYSNSFLATKIIYNNQFSKWCENQGVEWNTLKEVLKEDRRLGNSHYDVPGKDGDYGYGGDCFPKDINAIMHIAEQNNIDLSLLKFQVQLNNDIKQKQEEQRRIEKEIKSHLRNKREDRLARSAERKSRRR